MSVKQCSVLTGLLAIVCLLTLVSSPGFALDEAAAKKLLCHKCLKDIYVAQGNLPAAGAEFQALLAIAPSDARLHFDYANFLLRQQKLPQAASEYQKAAHLQPGVPEYQAGMGNGFMYTKRYDLAVAAYTRACQLGGKCQNLLQTAQQYQAQTEQLKQYEKKVQAKKEEEDE
jgi:tetratricopeptide (TPR) repeat protein